MAIAALEILTGRQAEESEFEKLTWDAIQTGRQISGVQHAQDIEMFRLFGRQIAESSAPFDVVITPTMPDPPKELGTYSQNNFNFEEVGPALSAACCFTAPFNVSGQPAISLPLHWTDDGLPVGVQFAGNYADEAVLIRLAAQIEKAKPWIAKRPGVCA
jgi:amidase